MNNNKNGISALIWSSADKVLTNGLALFISILLARIIDPAEYGIVATASIFTVLLSLFVEPGMTSALIQKKNCDSLDYSTMLTSNLAIGAGLYGLLFLSAEAIGQWFELPVLSSVLRVMGLQILIGSINSVQIAYVHRNMLFRRYFICSFTSVSVAAVIAIVMAYQGYGVWALVAYNLIRTFVNTVMTFFLFRCRFGFKFSKERFMIMFPFAGKMLFAKFIDQGYVEITQAIISKAFSSAELAFYNKGKSFPDLLISNLNSALGNVMFPFFSNLQDDSEKLKSSLRESVKMTSFVCMPVLAGLIACGNNFIRVLLTDKWSESVPFLQLFCFYYIWIPFSNLIWQSLKAMGKSNVILKLEIVKMILNISTLVFFLWRIKSPIAVAISIAVTYTLSFFVECFMSTRHLNYHAKEIFADFVPSFLVSAGMCVFVWQIGHIVSSPLGGLILQVCSGVVFYIVAVSVLRFPQVKKLLSLLKHTTEKSN